MNLCNSQVDSGITLYILSNTYMKTAIITTKIDPILKDEAQELAKKLGTTLSAVINNAVKRFVSEKKLVIESYIPNEETIRAFEEADADRAAGRTNPIFDNADDFMKHLYESK